MKFITIFYTITTVLLSVSVNLSAAATCGSPAAASLCDSPETQTASVFTLVGRGSCVPSPEAASAEDRAAAQASAIRTLFNGEPLPGVSDAEKGAAAFKAGMAYWNAEGVEANYPRAMAYFEQSSHYGCLDANVALSECYCIWSAESVSPMKDNYQNKAYKLLIDVMFRGSPSGAAYQRAAVLLKERFDVTFVTRKSAS